MNNEQYYNSPRTSLLYHLAGLAMHVKSDCNAGGHLTGTTVHQIFSQSGSEVALTRPARPREDKTSVFK